MTKSSNTESQNYDISTEINDVNSVISKFNPIVSSEESDSFDVNFKTEASNTEANSPQVIKKKKNNKKLLLSFICDSLLSKKKYDEALNASKKLIVQTIPKSYLEQYNKEPYRFIRIKKYAFGKNYREAKATMFLALYFLGHEDDALSLFNSLRDITKDRAFELLKTIYKGQKHNQPSIEKKLLVFLEKLIKINSKDYWALHFKGYYMAILEKYDNSIRAYRKSLDLNPKCSNTMQGLGFSLEKSYKYSDAIDSYIKASHIDPNYESVFYLASILEKFGCYKQAILVLKRFNNYMPNNFSITKYLFCMIALEEGFDRDKIYVDQLSDEEQINALHWLIYYCKKSFNYQLGLSVSFYLMDLDPKKNLYIDQYLYFTLKCEGIKEFDIAFQRLENNKPDFNKEKDLILEIAQNCICGKKYDKAKELLEEIISNDRYNIAALQNLACTYYLSSNKEDFDASTSSMLPNIISDTLILLIMYKFRVRDYSDMEELFQRLKESSIYVPESQKLQYVTSFLNTVYSIYSNDFESIEKEIEFQTKSTFEFKEKLREEIINEIYSDSRDFQAYEKIMSEIDPSKEEITEFILKLYLDALWISGKRDEAIIRGSYFISNLNMNITLNEIILDSEEYIKMSLSKYIWEYKAALSSSLIDTTSEGLFKSPSKEESIKKIEYYMNLYREAFKVMNEPKESGFVFYTRDKEQVGSKAELKEKNKKYDLIYYKIKGTKHEVDYARSFISKDTLRKKTSSGIPLKIFDIYNAFYSEFLVIEHAQNSSNCDYKVSLAPKIQTKKQIHGAELYDSYSWMNTGIIPNDLVSMQLQKENYKTDTFFSDKYKLIQDIEGEMYAKVDVNTISGFMSGAFESNGYEYYNKHTRNSYEYKFCRKRLGADTEKTEEVLIDTSSIKLKNKSLKIEKIYLSESHQLLAYGIDYSGNEKYSIKILCLETKKAIKCPIENALLGSNPIYELVWHKRKKGFFFISYDYQNLRFYDLSQDEIKEIDLNLKHYDTLSIYESNNNQYLIIEKNFGVLQNEILVIDLNSSELTPILIKSEVEGIKYNIQFDEEYIYCRTNDHGGNYRIIRCDINELKNSSGNLRQEIESWHDFITIDRAKYLESFSVTKNFIILNYLVDIKTQIHIIDKATKEREKLIFDEDSYAASVYAYDTNSDEIRVKYTSLKVPDITYSYDTNSRELKQIEKMWMPESYNNEEYETKLLFAENEGVKVPISILYKKSLLKRNGENPLYLYAYGHYGITSLPKFSRAIFSLVDRGFVCAIAHVRGSGDNGYDWALSSRKLTKKNTYSDFIAASQYLIKEKYTSDGNIVAAGGSAGGGLVSIAANTNPELYRAIIAEVPSVDLLNYTLNCTRKKSMHLSEYGSARDSKVFNYIKSYCPYQNIKKQFYPAIYATIGLNDLRINYSEALKWITKVREFNLAKSHEKPTLLRIYHNKGHFTHKISEMIKQKAEQYAFILSLFSDT